MASHGGYRLVFSREENEKSSLIPNHWSYIISITSEQNQNEQIISQDGEPFGPG